MDPDSNSPRSTDEPFPGPLAASLLALSGLFISSFIASVLASSGIVGHSPLMVSMGIGYALGLGGLATLASRSVPPPHDVRLGLRNFDRQLIPALLALLPCVFLLSELNFYLEWILPPSPEFMELREEMEAMPQGRVDIRNLGNHCRGRGYHPHHRRFLLLRCSTAGPDGPHGSRTRRSAYNNPLLRGALPGFRCTRRLRGPTPNVVGRWGTSLSGEVGFRIHLARHRALGRHFHDPPRSKRARATCFRAWL